MHVGAKIEKDGLTILVNKKPFKITYPADVWNGIPFKVKQTLLENITFATTHYLPLVLGDKKAVYEMKFPLLESYFFRNQMCDLLDCENADSKPHLSYIRRFYNLDFEFKDGASTAPDFECGKVWGEGAASSGTLTRLGLRAHSADAQRVCVAVVPFTFGKESLATFALCLELGIKPVLVYCEEPVQPYEAEYKLKELEKIRKKYKVPVYHIKNGTGLFRYGKAFPGVKRTEIGWGTQTTILAMMMIPFVYAHKARYIFFGSEYSNNEYHVNNGWKVFHSYDQTSFWTNQQDSIVQILTVDQCRVRATFEPLDEINIFYMLHHRYPDLGKYQFSCFAEEPLVGGGQWCHNCYKCSRMFIFARACGIDPYSIGFKEDILAKKGMFDHYLGKKYATGSSHELDFAFYSAMQKGVKSPYIEEFKKKKLGKMRPWKWYVDHFTSIKPYCNLPEKYEKKLIKIYREELREFRKEFVLT
jgi:hypothetical protein